MQQEHDSRPGGPSVSQIVEAVIARFPTQKEPVLSIYQAMTDDETESFAVYLGCVRDIYSMTVQEMVDCYAMFVNDTLEETRFFFRHGRYRYATYPEVDAYMRSKNPRYMRAYQVGILLSLFLWPNHAEMRRHFSGTLEQSAGGDYLEVGVGHGYYFHTALSSARFDRYLGVDISADSLHMAENALGRLSGAHSKPYRLEQTDFLDMSSPPEGRGYAFIASGEVLEHVENPQAFVDKMAALCQPGGTVYITTAINAPEIDHIALFRSPEEVEALFEKSGLTVTDTALFLYRGNTLERSLKRKLPISIALTARKG